MPKAIDIILKVVFPQMAAHVPGLNGLALRHLAMITGDQGVFKGVWAVPTGEKWGRREPVVGSSRSGRVCVCCDGGEGEFVWCRKRFERSCASGDCCSERDALTSLVVAKGCSFWL